MITKPKVDESGKPSTEKGEGSKRPPSGRDGEKKRRQNAKLGTHSELPPNGG